MHSNGDWLNLGTRTSGLVLEVKHSGLGSGKISNKYFTTTYVINIVELKNTNTEVKTSVSCSKVLWVGDLFNHPILLPTPFVGLNIIHSETSNADTDSVVSGF